MVDLKKSVSIPFHTFEHNLDHAITFAGVKKNEAKYLKNFLYRINRYVKKLKQENPNITRAEVEEIFARDLVDFSDTSYRGVEISKNFMNYLCYDLFDKQPERFDHYSDLFDSLGTCSFEEIQELPRSTFALTQLYYAAKLRDEFSKSGFTDIREFLKHRLSEMTPEVKDDISQSTLSILQQLDKLDLLYSYLDINDKKMAYLGFDKYADTFVSADSDHKADKLLSIFADEDAMKSKTPFDLLTLYSFWVNRYYKELDTYSEAMFVIRDLDLIPSMLDGTFRSPSKEDLSEELIKMNLFYDPIRFILEMQKAEKLKANNESEYDISENIYAFPNDTFLHYIQTEYGKKYKSYFDQHLPQSKNDLIEDASHYYSLYSPIFATCGLKDATMLYLLIGLKENAYYSNAGVIPRTVNPQATQADLGKFVGIGIDNGMTDTFLLHIKKSTLSEFIESYMLDSFSFDRDTVDSLPMFEGRTDYTNGIYSIPILAPMTPEQISLINEEHSNLAKSVIPAKERKRADFINHLNKVMHYQTSHNQSQRFVDLKTGRITSKQKAVER